MSSLKWEIGPVKLANGSEAEITRINEGQEEFLYVGHVMVGATWIPAGWHACGRMMYTPAESGFTLAPPPKKTVRVRCWLNVDASEGLACFLFREDADRLDSVNRIACIEVDRIVTEGEGL